MSKNIDKKRKDIIQQLIKLIQENYSGQQAELLEIFVERYFENISYEDLQTRGVKNLYHIVTSHFRLIHQRKISEKKVCIYNPTLEKDGWTSPHTIIEISHDDMCFLVDSIRMEINRCGFVIHLTIHLGGIHLRRNHQNKIIQIFPKNEYPVDALTEAPIYVEIDRQTDLKVLKDLQDNLLRILNDVSTAIEDLPRIKEKLQESLIEVEKLKKIRTDSIAKEEVSETIKFLRWLDTQNFTFLGYRDYKFIEKNKEKYMEAIGSTGLGVLRNQSKIPHHALSEYSPKSRKVMLSSQILVLSKTQTRATVHRPVYTESIEVKQFDDHGHLTGVRRFIGLYTTNAYRTTPLEIPMLCHKIKKVIEKSGVIPNSHSGRELSHILEVLPRDDLFQIDLEELLELAMGILYLQDRQCVRLFIRQDNYGRFLSCLVFIPRNNFTSELCEKMKAILKNEIQAQEVSYSPLMSGSLLVCVHFVVRIDPSRKYKYSPKDLEKKLVEISRSWLDNLKLNLIKIHGEIVGEEVFNRYSCSFPAAYRDEITVEEALSDIEYLEKISEKQPLEINCYPSKKKEKYLFFKIFSFNDSLPLSDALPILENMGMRVMGEISHEVQLKSGGIVWINNFEITYLGNNVPILKDENYFQESFKVVWLKLLSNDQFNQLVISARLDCYEVNILRVYAKYARQIGLNFSEAYIAETLISYSMIAHDLIELFKLRFDPLANKKQEKNAKNVEKILQNIQSALDKIVRLDHDRICRRYLELINATVRTNYFQRDKENIRKPYLSFKINPALIQEMPLPRPMVEIYVYSISFEAIHLRGRKVARGGIRWSDRIEDFRTEVLELMKAQQVKNACIVPGGAKGGFVPKLIAKNATRDEIMAEGINCYRMFIRALLEMTDNLKIDKVIKPNLMVCYDDDDPYLVVAADKGTATFSDIANEISKASDFWLQDAFASGGSAGYDHKKIGITARGAWESVKRHFREIDRDIINTPFTVVGIGDMSGDVFGNAMLLSSQIKLVAAFNHIHIFIDPNPDPAKSFKERQRLFKLPRSSWDDYDKKLISAGGGVFSRSDKAVKITPEMKILLGTKKDSMIPSELIRAMLSAEFDLLWNGGIGTFVKASTQTEADVPDRGNEPLRVNANQLRCKVVGEGGNLGFTQLARIEYALQGGRIYTDFIDNSAGVDCSDHEVNIKILLNDLLIKKKLTLEKRNQLLTSMTEDVAALVLKNNYAQAQALSLLFEKSVDSFELYVRYMNSLAEQGKIDLDLEFLPKQKTLLERKAMGKGLTLPELAIIFSYSKRILKEEILVSDVPEDPFLSKMIQKEFPLVLFYEYKKQMETHSLRREIIAMQVSNMIINELGFIFIPQLKEKTQASVAQIIRAFMIAYKLLNRSEIWSEIEELDSKVNVSIQFKMMYLLNRLTRHATRWFLKNRSSDLNIDKNISYFSPLLNEWMLKFRDFLPEITLTQYEAKVQEFIVLGVPATTASSMSRYFFSHAIFDLIDIAIEYKWDIKNVAMTHYRLVERLHLDWLEQHIVNVYPADDWEALLRVSQQDSLDRCKRLLTIASLKTKEDADNFMRENHLLFVRWDQMVLQLKSVAVLKQVMFSVVIEELTVLTNSVLSS